ncbi:hypothetical protein BJ912DRAFT_974741 [Pholiota molesta]|nr:hypothetical protein BJ912DRAFT_974741 [Pholiota molesta]
MSALTAQGAAAAFLQQHNQQPQLDVLELLHAHPGGVQNLLAGAAAANSGDPASGTHNANANGGATTTQQPPSPQLRSLLSLGEDGMEHFRFLFRSRLPAAAAAGVAMGDWRLRNGNDGRRCCEFGGGAHIRDEDDGRGDGDYADHRHHGHGNTKKRKVPANAGGSPRAGDSGRPGSPSLYLDDEGNEIGGVAGEMYPPPPFPGQLAMLAHKRGKLTAVTLAGLQHKEMLKNRKRQLAAVMGALSHGDTLALDQALSANYPLVGGLGAAAGGMGSEMGMGGPPTVRKSRRRTVRLARAMKATMEMPERRNRHPDAVPFPTSEFSFSCPSGTADRLIATKEEVELELAAAANGTGTNGKSAVKATGGRGKRERQERDRERAERAQQRAKATRERGDQTPDSVDSAAGSVVVGSNASAGGAPGAGGGKAKNGKKKKRSALANASNPHHLRNYVPSRLPHSTSGDGGGQGGGGVNANANVNNTIWPLPIRFLSSEIPPRRRGRAKKAPPVAPVPLIQLTHPAEEWICAFCEYDLFYGDDAAYRRAVRSRKKILKRRRRARERAAAAASGAAAAMAKGPPPPPPPSEEYEGYDDGAESGVDEHGSAPAQRGGRWKAGPDKEEAAAFG